MVRTPLDDDLVLYTHPMSRGRIVRWMLEEVGQPYRTEVLDYAAAMKAPEYLAINPMGKVPALRHGSVIVTEAAAICAYLADAFPNAGLAPAPTAPERGPYYRWLFFAAGPVEAAVTNRALGFEVPPDRQRMAGYGTIEAVLETLAGALSRGAYLAGSGFTAADLYVGAQLRHGMLLGSSDPRPGFERYVQSISSRPALRRAEEIADALLTAARPQPSA